MTENRPFASLSSSLLARKGAARPAMRRPAVHSPLNSTSVHDDLGWNDMGYDVDPQEDEQDSVVRALPGNPLAAAIPEFTPDVRRQQEEIAAKLNIAMETVLHAEDDYEPESENELVAQSVPLAKSEIPESPQVEMLDDQESDCVVEDEVIVYTPPHDMPAPMEGSPLMARKVSFAAELSATPASRPEVTKIAPVTSSHDELAAVKAGPKAAFTLRLTAERHLRLRLACAVKGLSAQKLVTEALDELLRQMPEIEHLMEHVPGR